MWPSRSGEVEVFIFDRKYLCCLRIGELITLEKRTKSSLGEIWKRLDDGSWKITDLMEITRLGLIGGGMDAQAAATLLDQCFRSGQLLRFTACAARILAAAMVGVDDEEETPPDVGEPQAPADSTGAKSSGSAPKRASRRKT